MTADPATLIKDASANVAMMLEDNDGAHALNAAEDALAQRARIAPAGGLLAPLLESAYLFAASGFFKDATTVAKAAVKILIGRSLGLTDVASLANLYLFESDGRTVIIVGVHVLSAKIKTSDRYRYKITESTKSSCRIAFYEKGFLDEPGWTMIGEESFTIEDAAAAGLLTEKKLNWKRYPADMLFARTMARGFRRHCSDLIAITPYLREEFEDNEIRPIDITPVETIPSPRRKSDVVNEAKWPDARRVEWEAAHLGEGEAVQCGPGCLKCHYDAWESGVRWKCGAGHLHATAEELASCPDVVIEAEAAEQAPEESVVAKCMVVISNFGNTCGFPAAHEVHQRSSRAYTHDFDDQPPVGSAKCDGNHGGPICGDPECWAMPNPPAEQMHTLPDAVDTDTASAAAKTILANGQPAQQTLMARNCPRHGAFSGDDCPGCAKDDGQKKDSTRYRRK